jgi:quinol monooxygenase YgiN
MMLTFVVGQDQLRILGSRRDEVTRVVRSMNGPLGAEYGCSSSRLYQDVEDEGSFLLVQEWSSKAMLDRFVASSDYVKVLELMELAAYPPELKFHYITNTSGLETVRSIRES